MSRLAAASAAVNKEIADFREQTDKLLGMVDEMRFHFVESVPSKELTRSPAKRSTEHAGIQRPSPAFHRST